MAESENDKERSVRQALESSLVAGESLLAYASGTQSMLLKSKPCHLGLTESRLIIILPDQQSQAANPSVSIRREKIKSVSVRGGWSRYNRLEVKTVKDGLNLSVSGGWKKRAKALARLVKEQPPTVSAGQVVTPESLLQEAQDFQTLGMIASAQVSLKQATNMNPAIGMDPSAEKLKTQLAEMRLAMRVGTGFLFGNLGVIFLLSVCVVVGSQSLANFLDLATLWTIGISVYFGVNLWMGKNEQRMNTVGAVILGYVFTALSALGSGNFIGLVTGVGFAGSIALVLTGNSSRTRTWIAIGIYAIGYLGVLTLTILIVFVAAILNAGGGG